MTEDDRNPNIRPTPNLPALKAASLERADDADASGAARQASDPADSFQPAPQADVRFTEPFPLCRRADVADLDAITSIYNESIAQGMAGARSVAATVDEMAEWVLQGSERGLVVVAVSDGVVVGFAGIARFSPFKSEQHVGELKIHVSNLYRSKRVGTSLLEVLFDEPHRLGFHKVVARVYTENEAALRLYQAFGFDEVGRLREQATRARGFADLVLLERFL